MVGTMAASAGINKLMTKKPKSPDMSRQNALIAEQEASLKKQEAEAEDRKKKEAANTRARRGRSGDSLLTGLETGITPVQSSRRSTLG
jgi:hypothetical protein